ncbi:MAG TPA: dihydrofolate reductase family protein [Pirellulaceae bacterium]|jgi:dihydrofolate reductase|nr:dihydrofolate reductase family protein [Pirellulaceae bacterium]
MQCSIFIGTSLDGFIARRDGSIDWLDYRSGQASPGEDFGYKAFFDTVDVLIMGRKTLETVLAFDLPKWPYGDKPIVVLSRTWKELPAGCPASVSLSDLSPAELVAKLAREGKRRAYIDGGTTIQSFFAAGLINDLTITRVPILLGEGIPLFDSLARETPLIHESTRAYDCGLVQSRYRVGRAEG